MKPNDTLPYTLLIEDDPWLAKSYQTVIEEISPTRTVHSASEAIRLIDESLPRAIIADVMLDEGLVIDLLHELQSHSDTAPIPVVLCTALAPSLSLDELKPYGVVKILDKSTLTLDKLRNTLRELI